MFVIMALIARRSRLWRLDPTLRDLHAAHTTASTE
jgi:hypothetical protein